MAKPLQPIGVGPLADWIAILLFAGGISVPLLRNAFLGPESTAHKEQRQETPMPALSTEWAELEAWPEAFSGWYGDHFGFRSDLIRWHNRIKLEGFGISPTSEVVLGKDGWLFTTVHKSVEVFRGVLPFTPGELDAWRTVLEDREEWCRRRGIRYVFAIAPNKNAIYPEMMDGRYERRGPTRMDQLVEHLEEHSTARVLDLRPALIAAKEGGRPEQPIYFPLGTHWNKRGALVAYREILSHLGGWFPEVAPIPIEDFGFEETPRQGDTWAERLYMEDVLIQENVDWIWPVEKRARQAVGQKAEWITEVDDERLPRAVMFHDSFGEMFRPLLSEHFRRIAFYWIPSFDTAIVEREEPEVVIQLMVERGLVGFRPVGTPLDTSERLREQYRDSSETLMTVGGRFGSRALVPTEGMQIRPPEQKNAAALLTCRRGREGLLLPEFGMPQDRWAVLKIILDSPVETTLWLEFQTEGDRSWSRRLRAARRPLGKGTNQVFVKLMVPDLYGSVRIRPGDVPGATYTLWGVEARAVAR